MTDWVITKVQSGIGDGNDNGDGNPVEVFLRSPTPTPLPTNYPSLSRNDLVGLIEKLFGQIKSAKIIIGRWKAGKNRIIG
jgi:hypothetical protein